MAGVKFKTGIDLQGKNASNAADGVNPSDLVTLQQLQAYVRGLLWKDPVRAVPTANVSISAPGATIDGVTMASGDRVGLINQTTQSENGIWVWNGAAVALTRAVDADANAEVKPGLAFTIAEGTTYADKTYVLTTNGTIIVGTTALTFGALGGGGSAYTAGNGLSLAANQFSVSPAAGGGITVDGTGVKINTSIVNRKFAAACVATTNPQTFAHGLGTADLIVQVTESGETVRPGITVDATNITIDWGSAPTSGQYRVIATG